ncbi:MAG TPA: hypothetical protein VGX94_10930 [Terriglobia bacterium]|nr:hypothetical protein [Terriglobia bacterium]
MIIEFRLNSQAMIATHSPEQAPRRPQSGSVRRFEWMNGLKSTPAQRAYPRIISVSANYDMTRTMPEGIEFYWKGGLDRAFPSQSWKMLAKLKACLSLEKKA